MEHFLNLLNQNSGAVIAIFTGIYVLGTFLMWWEMRMTRLNIDEPRIQISLVPRRVRHLNVIDLLIENVGNVPIVNLKLSFSPPDLKNTYGRKLVEIFEDPIKTLGRDRSIKMIMFRDRDWGKCNQIKITAEYASLYNTGFKRCLDFNFDMQNFNFSDMPYEYGNEDLINELSSIGRSIQSLHFPIDEIRSILVRGEMEEGRPKAINLDEK